MPVINNEWAIEARARSHRRRENMVREAERIQVSLDIPEWPGPAPERLDPEATWRSDVPHLARYAYLSVRAAEGRLTSRQAAEYRVYNMQRWHLTVAQVSRSDYGVLREPAEWARNALQNYNLRREQVIRNQEHARTESSRGLRDGIRFTRRYTPADLTDYSDEPVAWNFEASSTVRLNETEDLLEQLRPMRRARPARPVLGEPASTDVPWVGSPTQVRHLIRFQARVMGARHRVTGRSCRATQQDVEAYERLRGALILAWRTDPDVMPAFEDRVRWHHAIAQGSDVHYLNRARERLGMPQVAQLPTREQDC